VDRVWENVEAVVEEEDEEKYYERKNAKLDRSTHLQRESVYYGSNITSVHTILRVIFGRASELNSLVLDPSPLSG